MPTKILAIDDSKTMRLAIKITFAAEDAEVTSVGKGTEAVARAKQVEADVILLDAKLADGEPSGLELCRQLKNDAATAKIPVILLVSNQDPPAASEVEAAGADDTVVKPFESQDLIDKVAAVQGKPIKAPIASPGFVKPAGAPAATPRPP
ncbi:MAG: response regulator, partial [Nannocystaceae bacterium]|nr:response regulator [Nannocystaceae bacterium]